MTSRWVTEASKASQRSQTTRKIEVFVGRGLSAAGGLREASRVAQRVQNTIKIEVFVGGLKHTRKLEVLVLRGGSGPPGLEKNRGFSAGAGFGTTPSNKATPEHRMHSRKIEVLALSGG